MNKKPRILITNDDGVHAPGIRHLWQAVKDYADIIVVAPTVEQSGVGLSITIREPLRIEEVEWSNSQKVWSVNGTPADCVKMALTVMLETNPDLIISGINRGTNAGRNVLYSGTVAATIEGALHGVPSIAFSCVDYHEPAYDAAGPHVLPIIKHVLENPLPSGTLLNVNFPAVNNAEVKGYKMTRMGKQYWKEDPDERLHPAGGHSYYWLGASLAKFDEEEDCDISWLEKGYIAAVPVNVGQMTDEQHLSARRSHFEMIL